jgi:hypothetical protein
MTPYRKALHAGFTGQLTLNAGTFQILYLRAGYTANTGDGGHEFESDLGANISHRQTLTGVTWSNRTFSAADLTVTDPNNGDTVTQKVIVKGTGPSGTNRLVAHQTLPAPVAWDGVADSQAFNASGIFRVGGA